jgi:hypothetical protein
MIESHEVVTVRGPSARSGRGLDNAAQGQRGHVGRAGSDPHDHARVRGARLLAWSPSSGDGPMGPST